MNLMSESSEEVSYIRPRDPSINCMNQYKLNRNKLNPVRINLQFSVNKSSTSVAEEHNNRNENECAQIYLRVKPSTDNFEYLVTNENELIYKATDRDLNNAKGEEAVYRKISFSKIFGMASKQVDIFDDIVKIKVFEFINGRDTTLFTYGATGSGRSFTTVGTAEEPGLLIRALEYLFKTLPELPKEPSVKPTPDGRILQLTQNQARSEITLKSNILKSEGSTVRLRNTKLYQAMQEELENEPFAFLEQLAEVTIGVWVTFAEIHNEEILDLLQSSVSVSSCKKRIVVSNGKSHIADLTHVYVSNGSEAFQVYQCGMQRLKSVRANMHNNVGRSNAIFTIKIAHTLLNRDTKFISAFNICNLANCVDNSVIVLGRCLTALKNSQEGANGKYLIPHRDSKLTQLFHRVCSGSEDCFMLINVDFSKEKLGETQNILKFSALTKKIVSKSVVLKYMELNSEHSIELHQKIRELKEAINERKTYYEHLMNNKSDSYELEKQAVVQGYEEILKDSKEFHERRKKHLEDDYTLQYNMELRRMRMDIKKKLERNKEKKTQKEIKYLKKENESMEIAVKNLENEISELEKDLDNRKDLSSIIESNKKLIAELEEVVEEDELDSFISNEKKFEEIVEANCD